MNNPHLVDRPDLIEIVDSFGNEVCNRMEEYYTPIVTVGSSEGQLIDITLYFLAPEISYEYRALYIEIKDVSNLKIHFFTISTKQSEQYPVNISTGTLAFQNKLYEIKNLGLFRAALDFLVNQTQLKREHRKVSIKDKIVIGQARVAILYNDKPINVGWIKIDDDDYVYYYTGIGLEKMWKPNMNPDELKEATLLRQKEEAELMKLKYIEKRKISDFKDVK